MRAGDRLLRIGDVAPRFGMCTRTARRHLKARTGELPAPCREKPYKWRASDVDAFIAGLSVVSQRQQRAKKAHEVAA